MEDFLPAICLILKLSPGHCVMLAYCLAHSQYKVYVQDALKVLKAKLPELVSSGTLSDLNEDALKRLFEIIYKNEVRNSFANVFFVKSNPDHFLDCNRNWQIPQSLVVSSTR